ncbi:hypothetical protein [Marinomonas spartinae]|nr:hypothetical protein [Marinomonas spartinae]
MKSMKKDPINEQNNTDLVEEARQILKGAKDWFLDDVSLMKAYWHDKMGYTEAWIDANWHLVLEEGEELTKELDAKEDAALLWLINHANNNPVPLEECHVAGQEAKAGVYHCMACGHDNIKAEDGTLEPCEVCHYGLMSTHQEKDD